MSELDADAVVDALGWTSLSREDLEREYSPSSCIGGDIGPYIAQYRSRSIAARDACYAAGSPVVELSYGPKLSQTLDLSVPQTGETLAPLVVFIHGGYWQELSKAESFFGATDCLDQGVAYAAIDYTLAPEASLDAIVTECEAAIEFLVETAQTHGIDPSRIVLAGSSAGAHLAAMVALRTNDGWQPAGVALLSGIYDLEPLLGTSINDALHLDEAAARANSPLRFELANMAPTVIAYGANETDQFKRQSNVFGRALVSAGSSTERLSVQRFEVPMRNHFDIVFDLCDLTSELGNAVLALTSGDA